jgi:hypothetical protein
MPNLKKSPGLLKKVFRGLFKNIQMQGTRNPEE